MTEVLSLFKTLNVTRSIIIYVKFTTTVVHAAHEFCIFQFPRNGARGTNKMGIVNIAMPNNVDQIAYYILHQLVSSSSFLSLLLSNEHDAKW